MSVKLIVFKLLILSQLTPFSGELFAHWKIPASVKNWRTVNTAHFKIHYPEGYEELGLMAAVYAEEAATHFSQVLRHRLSRVVPVFVYASHQDFSATNIMPYLVDEGTGGFTDFFRRRVVLPFTGDYAAFRHVLSHEIVHAFQFDILGRDNPGRYPLWLMEGMAEYLTLGWDATGEENVREAVLYNRMPSLAMLHSGQVGGFMYYKGGQAIMDFMATRWSVEHIGRFFKELRTLRNLHGAFQSVFELPPEQFDIEFGGYLRNRYAKAYPLQKDERLRRVTYRYQDRVGFNLHPVLSPDGKRVAYLTVQGIFPTIVIRPTPGPAMSAERQSEVRIVIKALRSKEYEEWQPLTTRLSFSPDGRQILVAGRSSGEQSLLLIDLKSGKVVKSWRPLFDSIQYPVFAPDGKEILFTGVLHGKADLFGLRPHSGEIIRYTDDWFYESDPALSPDGSLVYYSSNALPGDSNNIDRAERYIYRLNRDGRNRQLIYRGPGVADNPQTAASGDLVIRSNLTGVFNLYRIRAAATRSQPAKPSQLEALTESSGGVANSSLRLIGSRMREHLVFVEREEGAFEIKLLPPPASVVKTGLDSEEQLEPVSLLSPARRTFEPDDYQVPVEKVALKHDMDLHGLDDPYRPILSPLGSPMLMFFAAPDENGKPVLFTFLFAQLADNSGDHFLGGFINYVNSPRSLNMDLSYAYLRNRMNFYAGAFRQDGIFPITNFMDISLNNLLYNPNFRLRDQESTGIYGGVEYPLHRFGAVMATLQEGRDEKLFSSEAPEERERDDIYKNYTQLSVAYRRNNLANSYFGPLDGHSLLVSYSLPLRNSETYRQLYSTNLQFSLYHLFSTFHTFALKFSAGVVRGPDADDYPYALGGYYSLRGYNFLQFEGKNSFLLTLEYRFNFIDFLQLAFPFRWSIGTIRGLLFFDAGSAFDNPHEYRAYDREAGVTRDLHLSFGVGLHWRNFLNWLVPGTIMKLEWATPYDLKRALPVSRWRGTISFGFSFD